MNLIKKFLRKILPTTPEQKLWDIVVDNPHKPKNATGFYVVASGIIWGCRTNRRKFPDNFIPFDQFGV